MRRRQSRGRGDNSAAYLLFFGLGLLLSVFCSPSCALFLAALALIWLAAGRC